MIFFVLIYFFFCRVIVGKDPRLLSLDMDSTVPRKIGALARAIVEHTEADVEEIAAIMQQVTLVCASASSPCFLIL